MGWSVSASFTSTLTLVRSADAALSAVRKTARARHTAHAKPAISHLARIRDSAFGAGALGLQPLKDPVTVTSSRTTPKLWQLNTDDPETHDIRKQWQTMWPAPQSRPGSGHSSLVTRHLSLLDSRLSTFDFKGNRRHGICHRRHPRRTGARPGHRSHYCPHLSDLDFRSGRAGQAQGLRIRPHLEPD